MPDDLVNVRYMVSGVQESIDFSTTRWRGCALPAWRFATRSSPDPADSRS